MSAALEVLPARLELVPLVTQFHLGEMHPHRELVAFGTQTIAQRAQLGIEMPGFGL